MFESTGVCEQAFSHTKKIKNLYRLRLIYDHFRYVLKSIKFVFLLYPRNFFSFLMWPESSKRLLKIVQDHQS